MVSDADYPHSHSLGQRTSNSHQTTENKDFVAQTGAAVFFVPNKLCGKSRTAAVTKVPFLSDT